MMIEKMALADGLKRCKDKRIEDKIKTRPIEKLDIMAIFRRKYQWYFEARGNEQRLNRTLKVKK